MPARRPALLLVTVLALSALPARAATFDVRAGSLAARIEEDPWHLTFVDEHGVPVLVEARERIAAAGPIGFRTAAGWAHATRALAIRRTRDALTATVATTDPLGRTLEVQLAHDAEGVLALSARIAGGSGLDVTALGIAFEAAAGERFLGFGERANAVDQRGSVVESYVADGPYQAEERPFVGRFVPAAGFRERDDATYFPVPWLLSTRGIGVLVDDAETSYFRLGTDHPERWSIEVVGAPEGMAPRPAPEQLRLRVFGGPRPADVLRRFTARTGRQPEPAAPWLLGPWIQLGGSLADRLAQMAKLRAADAPVSVVQTYTHYLPCGDHRADREKERAQVRALHAAGVAVTTYVNPMICASYAPVFAEAVAAGALSRDSAGGALVYDYTGSTIFRVGQFDFAAPAGRALYGRLLDEAIADGHDGWMEDFGEYTPLAASSGDGLTGAAYHNLYPVQYHCAAYAAARAADRPIVRFQRSGWTGVAPCAQVVWGGDPSTTWGFDGLTSALWSGLGMGLSGIGMWGSDVGGFFALGERALTAELLTRWVQLGAVSGVMRTQHNGFALPAKPRPQIYDDDQLPNWKRYAKLRTQLLPYLTAAAREYRRSGMPIMRHLALAFPDDAVATGRDDEFLFGPDLLVAPVLEPGIVTRDVYLPAGSWIDLWRAASYESATGDLVLGGVAVIPGRRQVTVPAPLEELPLFVRAGAILPLLPPDVDTLADYGDPVPGLVKLADRDDQLALLAFPRGRAAARMLRSERLLSVEARDGWRLDLRGKRRRTYTLAASLASLRQPFIPCDVTWNGRHLLPAEWSYDAATRVVRVRFSGRRGRLLVRRTC